jgi:hypothetical protein
MRYGDRPQSFYVAMNPGDANAMYYGTPINSHHDAIDSLEKPAVIADTLLRFDQVQWSLVTAIDDSRLILSLRTSSPKMSASDVMKRLVKNIGEGGGHRTKAGGVIHLTNATPAEVERVRAILRRRYLRALKIDASSRGQRLVPRNDAAKG